MLKTILCVVYALVRHAYTGADEDGHKWHPPAAHKHINLSEGA